MQLLFDSYPGVISGISERSDGSMIWWNRLPVDEMVKANRDRYFQEQGIDPKRVVAGGLVHGIMVTKVGESDAGTYILNSDGLITNTPNLFLSVTAADCLPVYFADPVTKSIGLAHAGWRGLVSGILEQVVREMGQAFGSKPENIHVVIGPHIQACHFYHSEEVASQFAPQNVERRDGQFFIKLGDEAAMRLRHVGVKDVTISPICTFDDARFYSARRDQTDPLEGMMAYIGMRK